MRNIIAMVLILVMACLGFSQEVSGDSLLKMLEYAKNYYNRGEYEQAITELEQALQFLKQLNRIDQVEAYKYLAFSYVAFGEKEKAKEQFRLALKLDPKMELDPSTVSPKIIKVFEEVKAEVTVEPPISSPTKPAVNAPSGPPSAAAASHKSPILATGMSCVLPGLGQMYRGEKKTGMNLMIAAGATVVPFLISAGIAEKKYQDYLDVPPGDPDEMDQAYRSYRVWFNIRSYTAVAYAGVWLYNLYDIIFTKSAITTTRRFEDEGFYCQIGPSRCQCGYRVKY